MLALFEVLLRFQSIKSVGPVRLFLFVLACSGRSLAPSTTRFNYSNL